ncbi:hypothetical protein KR093_009029 [Drosophila rubida]|uniref:Uncharacterized protein n=1 Tax=Drosophila rubida TaxID=30044 RepID=A0AAD4K1F7_9MUSC|nr:hypothetical protein KR093_009029 [Drosophila rubida]
MHRSLFIALLLALAQHSAPGAQADEQPAPLPTAAARPGHYVHQLHGAGGWYVPDNSGKYRHEPRPYDGGYGDRGQPYANDLRGIFRQAEEQLVASVQQANDEFALGPRDHLRFMIDFNYNGTGWQIIQFEWVRDGDGGNEEQQQYKYVNENKLWDTDAASQGGAAAQPSYDYQQPADPDCTPEQQQTNYEAEAQQHQQHSSIDSEQDPAKVQYTINNVLEYIQQRILPTLN